MNKLSLGLMVALAATWGMMFMLFLDNRALAGLAHNRADKEWVRPATVSTLAEACGRLSYVNKVDQTLLYKAKEMLDDIEDIQTYNASHEESQPGKRKTRRRGGDGQIRSVSRHADEGGDVGRGGPR